MLMLLLTDRNAFGYYCRRLIYLYVASQLQYFPTAYRYVRRVIFRNLNQVPCTYILIYTTLDCALEISVQWRDGPRGAAH
jgi:hypothetical protein